MMVGTLGSLLFVTTPAWACSCAIATFEEQVDRVDLIAHAVVTDVEFTEAKINDGVSEPEDSVFLTLDVSEIWKGDPTAQVVVGTAASSASCGLELPVGSDVVLFARQKGEGWTAGLCDGTAPAVPEVLGHVNAQLGPGVPAPVAVEGEPEEAVTQTIAPTTANPSADAPDPAKIVLPVIVAAAVVAGVAMLALRQRRPEDPAGADK